MTIETGRQKLFVTRSIWKCPLPCTINISASLGRTAWDIPVTGVNGHGLTNSINTRHWKNGSEYKTGMFKKCSKRSIYQHKRPCQQRQIITITLKKATGQTLIHRFSTMITNGYIAIDNCVITIGPCRKKGLPEKSFRNTLYLKMPAPLQPHCEKKNPRALLLWKKISV